MRIILFTGKGGVGKTTTATATAMRSAQLGYKTLIISTDPAHSLSDALDLPLGPEPTFIKDNLWGQELDVYYSMKKHWEHMRHLMLSLFKWRGVKNIVAEELAVLPGMEEASAFLWIEQYHKEKKWDLLIIDAAPTGETLTLLSLPQVVQSWVNKAFPKLAVKTIGSIIRKTSGVPIDKGMEELEKLFDKLERVQKIMQDKSVCSVRIVLNPEKMVIQEAKRAFTYLQLYGYQVDAIIANRILPPSMDFPGSVFEKYFVTQKEYLEEIEESFNPLPIFQIPHLGHEVFGLELLKQMGEKMYQNLDPKKLFYAESPFKVKEDEEHYFISIHLPFLNQSAFTLNKFGDEILIHINGRRKTFFLPKFAQYMVLKDHSYHNQWLEIQLQKNKI